MDANFSIIFVNYNSAELILRAINSIYQYNQFEYLEIIVSDNKSSEGQKEIISNKYPSVKWIEMGYNSGFARANNEGIRRATSPIVLLLNSDVQFQDDSLRKCYNQFSDSDYVACSVQLLNSDKSPQISGGYFIKGGLNNLLPLPVLGKIFKALGSLMKLRKTSLKNADELDEVDWINGAYMMVKKNVIERSGLLDEDFFLFAEEIEWCSRIRKYGKICIYGQLHAIHLQGETTNQTFDSRGKGYYNLYDKKGRQILISNFVRIRKQFGVGWFLFQLGCYFVEIPFFFLLTLIKKICFIKQGFRFSHFAGYFSNLFYLLGKGFIIIRNRPYFYKAI